MKTTHLERIRQKAEKYENRRKETTPLQDQDTQTRLERILEKAEELEKEKQKHREWNDYIQAIRETYGLSEEEIQAIILEVEQEEQESQPLTQPKTPEADTYEKLKALFFSPKGRIKRGTFALSLITTVIFQGLVSSIASKGLPPLGLLVLVALYSQIVLCIKRFHDLDKTGLFSLLALVPFINFFVFIYLFFFPGTDDPNRFDEDSN